MTSPKVDRIALVGDMHGAWDAVDVRQFNRSEYDLVLFIGDLGTGTKESDRAIARTMAKLECPGLVMPGNNDADNAALIEAELRHRRGMSNLLALFRGDAAAKTPGVVVGGYSAHRYASAHGEFTILCARPYAMGGGQLPYADFVKARFGVSSLEESEARLIAMVEAVETEAVLFVGHQGPIGLGAAADELWSADFLDEPEDWGDADLRAAIEASRARGHRVLGVLAGHMHHALEGGGTRRWRRTVDGIPYVNPARVPRIFAEGDNVYRHHVAIDIGADVIEAREVLVPEYE